MFTIQSFSVLGRPVYLFGLCLALGYALFYGLLRRALKKTPALRRMDALSFTLLFLPLSIFLGRLLFVAIRPSQVFFDAVEGAPLGAGAFFNFDKGGLSYVGVLLAAPLAGLIFSRRYQLPLAQLNDALVLPLMTLLMFFRLGYPLAGQGYGEMMADGFKGCYPFFMRNQFGEWHVAVYFFEALLLLAGLIIFAQAKYRRFPAALAFAAAVQVFFEALHRDDYLRLEINGFIRMEQVLCMALLLILCARAVKTQGVWSGKQKITLCLLTLLAILAAVGAEFYEKLPLPTLLLYGMSAGFACALALYHIHLHKIK